MSAPPSTSPETVIEPTRGLSLGLGPEFLAYGDLLWLLVWRDIAARYKQTVLGPLWHVVQPLMTTAVFMLIFSRVGRIPTNGIPSSLFYLSGLLVWNFFAQSFQSTAGTLVNNAALFGKVYFPRLIVPISATLSNLAASLIQLATFFVVYGLEKIGPRGASFGVTGSVCLLPLVFAQVAILSLGAGLWLAALTAKYRDLTVLAGFLVQLWMYASPVIYPLSRVPARWYALAALNPMTFPIETLRLMLLGGGSPSLGLGALSIALTLLAAGSGLIAFHRAEKTFIDVV